MFSRLGFYDLEENLEKYIKIRMIDLMEKIGNFFTHLNAVETSKNTPLKIEMVRKAESEVKEMLQVIISKVNPDLNRLIELDQKENDSYKTLVLCIGLIQNRIEKSKEEIMNKLSNFQRNDITNKIALDNFSSYLYGVVNDLIFTPLKEALIKFLIIEKMDDPVTSSIKTFEGKIITIKKDSNLFWYLAFSYMLRSSQIIGFMTEIQLKAKPFDITDAKKLITTIMKQKNSGTGPKEGAEAPKIEGTKQEIPPVQEKKEIPQIQEESEEEDEEDDDEDYEEFTFPKDEEEKK